MKANLKIYLDDELFKEYDGYLLVDSTGKLRSTFKAAVKRALIDGRYNSAMIVLTW